MHCVCEYKHVLNFWTCGCEWMCLNIKCNNLNIFCVCEHTIILKHSWFWRVCCQSFSYRYHWSVLCQSGLKPWLWIAWLVSKFYLIVGSRRCDYFNSVCFHCYSDFECVALIINHNFSHKYKIWDTHILLETPLS